MFVTFVDYNDPQYSKACFKAVQEITKVAEKFKNYFGFFVADNDSYIKRKRVLGVTWDELPAMAFNMIDQRVLPYPKGKKMEKDILLSWFDDVLKGNFQPKVSGF